MSLELQRTAAMLQNPDKPITWQMYRISPDNHVLQFARINQSLKKAGRTERWLRIERQDTDALFGYGLWNLVTVTKLLNKREREGTYFRLPKNDYQTETLVGDRRIYSCRVDPMVIYTLCREKVFENFGIEKNAWQVKAPFLQNLAYWLTNETLASYQVLARTRRIEGDNSQVWLDMTVGSSFL